MVRRLSVVFDLVKDDVADVRTLLRILCSMLDQQKVDFQGMPFGGLQVMGILETRAIDFDDVIVLDMTEGAWPPAHQGADTMIPLFLRNANRMMTPDDVDSTYNYYFYRLKSRARRLTFIRPTATSGYKTSQLSRYVLQIQKLLRQQVDVVSAQKGVEPFIPRQIEIDKRSVADVLLAAPLSSNGDRRGLRISPSALGDYVTCPMLFYFKRVINLRLDDEINEEADSRQLGLIYHAVMEAIYSPRGIVLTQSHLEHLLSKDYEPELDRLILGKLCEELNNPRIKSVADLNGRNILIFFTLKKLVRLTLETEQPGTTVVAAEDRINNLIMELPSGRTAVLTGSVDRQHIAPSSGGDGVYYVADYKTGSVGAMSITSLQDLFDPSLHIKNKAILQVLMYCYFLRHKKDSPVSCPMIPYILKVKDLSKDSRTVKDGGSFDKVIDNRVATFRRGKSKEHIVYEGEVEAEFERLLAECIDEIFDVDVPFRQTEKTETCGSCDFINICKR